MKIRGTLPKLDRRAAKRFLLDGIRTKERGRHADLASRHGIWSTGDAVLTEAALAFDCMDRMPPPGHRQGA